jgi:hypothetical protein
MSAAVRAETFWQRVVLHLVIFVIAALPLGMTAYALVTDTPADGSGGVLDLIAFLPGPALLCAPGILFYTVALDAVSARIPPGPVICVLLTPLVVLPWLTINGMGLAAWPVFVIGIGVALLAFGVLVSLAQRAGWFVRSPRRADGAPTA